MSSLGFSGVLGVTVRTCTSKTEAEGTRRVCAEGGGCLAYSALVDHSRQVMSLLPEGTICQPKREQ